MHPPSLLVQRLPSCRSIVAFWNIRCTNAFQVPSSCFGGRHWKSLHKGPDQRSWPRCFALSLNRWYWGCKSKHCRETFQPRLYLALQVPPFCWTQQSDITWPSMKLMIPSSWPIFWPLSTWITSIGERQHHWSIWALQKVRSRMKEAGFNLRKWMSSSKRLMDWIDEGVVPAKEVVKLSEEDST